MSTISVGLPDSIHQHAKRPARRDGYSLNQLIASAVREKLAALEGAMIEQESAEGAENERTAAVTAFTRKVSP